MDHEIKLLPEHIVNQIKAGEVVESPATLLKEVIENSLDSGATKIEISISEDLTTNINIKDNGSGIDKKNVPLAFTRHATSKIYQFNDIYQLTSFGFRGEALASIASISDIKCRTTKNKKTTTAILEQGNIIKIDENDSKESSGTELNIQNIFHNTPARLKFIRSKTTEKNKINKIIDVFIVSNPHVTFIIQFGEKEKKYFPAITGTNPITKRIIQLISSPRKKVKQDNLFTEKFEYQGHQIFFAANKSSSKGSVNKKQYLLANNRYFKDRKIHHLITRKMNDLHWQPGQVGDYFCFITVPPEMMDPNVHPSKTEIKFINIDYILSGISSIIKNQKSSLLPNLVESNSHKKDNTEKSFEIEGTYFYQNRDSETSREVFSLFNDFFIVKDGLTNIHLYQGKKIFENFLIKFFENIEKNLTHLTTLLIGITFKSDELPPQAIRKLEQFELSPERINDETWILKEIPFSLSPLPSAVIKEIIVGIIIDIDIQKKSQDIAENYFSYLGLSTILSIINEDDKHRFCKKLTKDNLQSFFN